MSKRQSVKRHESVEVQGEGSFVVVSAVKVKEIRAIRKISDSPEFDDFEGGIKLLSRHVVDWNWVDDDDKPLPTPKEKPEIIEELTDQESQFLVSLLMGESKN